MYTYLNKITSFIFVVLFILVFVWLGSCVWDWKLINFFQFYDFSTWKPLPRFIFFAFMVCYTIGSFFEISKEIKKENKES